MRTTTAESKLPTGDVVFVFTDIESSTELLQRLGDERFAALIDLHNATIASTVESSGGQIVSTEGDSVFAVFTDAAEAVAASLEIQHLLPQSIPEEFRPLRVRIGIHAGKGVLGGDNYTGIDVHLASRVASSGHGGQVLLSDSTARLLADMAAGTLTIQNLGRYRLAGFVEPVAIHQVTRIGHGEDFPPLRSQRVESQLPRHLTDFIGRRLEVAKGSEILAEHRLLTLTGPGGTGKTRLALEIARENEPRFSDGAYFVGLSSLTDSALIAGTIAEALQLKIAGGIEPADHLKRHLEQRNLLMVLDNFEQILDGSGIVTDLLSVAHGVSMIVTSRSPLRVAGERELPVPPLGVPGRTDSADDLANAEGVRLFTARAEAVRPGFSLDDETLPTVAEITRRLDGLPLAIELAASRLRSLTPDVVLDRLGNKLLAAPTSDLPTRQRTIVDTIGWSYDLLEEPAKLLLEELSIFSGPFGLTAAEHVSTMGTDALDTLTDLVEQSLLLQTSTTGEARFRMLTVIREFAYAALVARGVESETADRHMAYFLDLASRAAAEILTSRQDRWLRRLSDDHDNLRSAFDRALAIGDAEAAAGFAGSLWRFWHIRGHLTEGLRRIESALAVPGELAPLTKARALEGLGSLLYWKGDWKAMLSPWEQALEAARWSNDEYEIANALYNVSFGFGYAGDFAKAESCLNESLSISEQNGQTMAAGRANWGLGNMAVYQGEFAAAIERFDRAVDLFSGLDAPFDLGWSWFMLAHSHVKKGEPEAAYAPLGKALGVFGEVGDVSALALILGVTTVLMVTSGDDEAAAYFLGAAKRLETDSGVAIGEVELNKYPVMEGLLERIQGPNLVAYEEGYNSSQVDVVHRARLVLEQGAHSP